MAKFGVGQKRLQITVKISVFSGKGNILVFEFIIQYFNPLVRFFDIQIAIKHYAGILSSHRNLVYFL